MASQPFTLFPSYFRLMTLTFTLALLLSRSIVSGNGIVDFLKCKVCEV
jgi:hypothetical protein